MAVAKTSLTIIDEGDGTFLIKMKYSRPDQERPVREVIDRLLVGASPWPGMAHLANVGQLVVSHDK